MKSYFAKYIPIEGEIKVGDNTFETLVTGEKMLWHIDNENDIDRKNQVKVKLFLCSRDIQVGDQLYPLHDMAEGAIPENLQAVAVYKANNAFKVIGEISPEALSFVKEGDEFDEYDEYVENVDDFAQKKVWCRVKGPCGHFH